MNRNRFACAATCMDGRIQAAVRKHLKTHYHVDWVDIVAQPGMNKFLAENNSRVSFAWIIIYFFTFFFVVKLLKKWQRQAITKNIKRMIEVSVLEHNANILAIVGHAECAGNNCDKEEQIKQLVQARKVIESFGFEVPIVLLWVRKDWQTIEVIGEDMSIATHSYNVYNALTP